MAESQKTEASSVKSKEKSSEIDLDFGKDFLSSWKDDGMDFDFGPAPKGKKKTFDFGKMDMDFNLDGDFDKLSSFKIDMSDLDISSPQKKTGKQMEQSKEVSPMGGHQNKKVDFSFSFDFNKFDDLNFGSTLTKGSEKSTKSKEIEGFSCQSDSSGSSGIHVAKDDAPMEEDTSSKVQEPPGLEACKNDNDVGRVKDFDNIEDGHSKSVTNDSCPPVPANSGEQVAIQRERTSPVQEISGIMLEHEQENHKVEIITHLISHHHEVVQDLSDQSAADNASTQDTASNIQEEDRPPTNLNSCLSGEENVSEKLITGPCSFSGRSIDEPLPSESMQCSMLKTGIDDVTINGHDNEPTWHSEFEHDTIPSSSKKLLQVAMSNGRNQDSKSKLHLTSLKSGTANADLVSEIKRGSNVIRSNYFKRPNPVESQLQKASLSQTKLISIESKSICSTQVSATDERRESDLNAVQRGFNLSGMSRSQPAELRAELIKGGISEGTKSINSTRECSDGSIESGSKLKGTSRTHDQDATRAGHVLSKGEKNVEDCNVPQPVFCSSNVSPISSNEQANKSTSKSCINPRLPVVNITSIKGTQSTSLEKSRISPPKAVKRIPEHPCLKSPRTSGEILEPLNPFLLKNIKSMRHLEKRLELQENIGPKRAQSAVMQKQTSPTLTLKRKAFEDSNADNQNCTPLKRLSASPNESRNKRESSDRAGNRQVSNHENVADDNTRTASKLCQTSTVDIPLELNLPEFETTLSIENDSVIKKAEACSKELEDICNMLKQKHEEAKEILVRAIVNNNNLLMLNHPMHQEKIRMVQKFAGLLLSK